MQVIIYIYNTYLNCLKARQSTEFNSNPGQNDVAKSDSNMGSLEDEELAGYIRQMEQFKREYLEQRKETAKLLVQACVNLSTIQLVNDEKVCNINLTG